MAWFRRQESLDLGHGVIGTFIEGETDAPIGVVHEHDRPDGKGRCESVAWFDVPEMRDWNPAKVLWRVESWEPLTLSPSLLCTRCGDHGFIRNGKWVPA